MTQYGRKTIEFKFVGLYIIVATYRLRTQFAFPVPSFHICEIGIPIINLEDC